MTDTGVDAQVSVALRSGTAHGLVSATQTAKTPDHGDHRRHRGAGRDRG